MRRPAEKMTTKMTVVAVVVVVMVMAAEVTGKPNGRNQGREPLGEDQDRSKDPVFNIWEFAISNAKYNPTRRETNNTKEPCTWAIVQCCSAPSPGARTMCFDENGCSGAWLDNLCSDHYQELARNEVEKAFSLDTKGFLGF
ncbi:uncharacterized protein LOC127010305 [Eriocheir sinensis]|uniref:uncharacterized protein LOC127010305 n=1 Tax=Eriocheir sinensis TaxID=95602 RepID=UPI0021CAB8EF|nr:uncharacterized protein LOC127010305 [Eriocheir sinensis]